MEKIFYVEKLNNQDLQKLVYLGLLECDEKEYTHFLHEKTLSSVTIENLTKDKENGFIQFESLSYNYKYFSNYDIDMIYQSNFIINDFEMTIFDGNWQFNANHILHMFLTLKFPDEYPKYLEDKRISDAKAEREYIEKSAKKYLEDLEENNNVSKRKK